MSIYAKLFVGFVFIVLGLSFMATSATLYYEFATPELGDKWLKLLTFYSHLFIFFPTFGLVALVAFYIPATAVTDKYWRHVPHGLTPFMIGLVVLVITTFYISDGLGKGSLRSLFEISPQALLADQGAPTGCNSAQQSCQRVPVLEGLRDVWEKSSARLGIARFVRNCQPDPLVEPPDEQTSLRYCFVTQTKLDAVSCCEAQLGFGRYLSALHVDAENRSLTGQVHKILLPLKVFFLLVILVIALLLIFWRHSLPRFYPTLIERIQRGVLIGAFAMVFLPLMNMAFLQSSGLLYGT
ncbi:MAG: hypothetical protein AAGG72_09140, partial [Pseudomonadota bacterium]